MLYKNPYNGVKTPKQQKSPTLAFSIDEQTAFLNSCNQESVFGNLFVFGFNTGMRLSEMLGLTWEDINWDDKTLCVENTVVETANHDKDATKKHKR